jgi:hypothetical protein
MKKQIPPCKSKFHPKEVESEKSAIKMFDFRKNSVLGTFFDIIGACFSLCQAKKSIQSDGWKKSIFLKWQIPSL